MSAMLPFDVEVREVNRLSENFVRITFGGAELDRFGVHGPTYDLRVKVMVPSTTGTMPDFKKLLQSPTWYSEWKQLDPDTRGYMRTYTAREYRTGDDPQLDVDFVMHLGDSTGPASSWASRPGAGDLDNRSSLALLAARSPGVPLDHQKWWSSRASPQGEPASRPREVQKISCS